ncbi:hypothetical protein CARUB_v100277372mg, partial [Capsella rubella]
KNSHDISTRC